MDKPKSILFTSERSLRLRSSSTRLVRLTKAKLSIWTRPHLEAATRWRLVRPRRAKWRRPKRGTLFPLMFRTCKNLHNDKDLTNLLFKKIKFEDEIQTIKMAKKGNIIPTNVHNLQRFWHSINPISIRLCPSPRLLRPRRAKWCRPKRGNIIPTEPVKLEYWRWKQRAHYIIHDDRFNEFSV